MTDRELLEAAAKASDIYGTYFDGAISIHTGVFNNGRYWNPLEDDGDALRLAVQLNLLEKHSFLDALREENDVCDGDYFAATRRAIVRAAAA
jgi:hypothetical protein